MFIEQTINGLAVGSVYALVAVGYSLIFGVLRILNLAHASFYAFAANMLFVILSMRVGIVPALIVAVILTGLLASAFNAGLLAPLREKQVPGIIHMITAIGFSYVIDNMLIAFLGSDRKSFPDFFPTAIIRVGNAKIQSSQIVMLVISLVLLAILSFIVNHTKLGLGMRASEQNPKAANLMGVNVKRTITITFFISGVYASLAGFLISSYYQMVYPTMGVVIGTKAFVSAVVGGIGVLFGSVVGGLIIGLAECYIVALMGANVKDAVSFVILIIVLLVLPNGLFGKKQVTKI